jgi:hypothetical protein
MIMAEPKTFIAGDTVTWTFSNELYPASASWILKYFLNSNNQYQISGSMVVASGTDFVVTIPAATTATYVAGHYRLIPQVSKSGVIHTLTSLTVEVLENPSKMASGDGRTTWVKCRDQLEVVILAKSAQGFDNQTVTTPLGTMYQIGMMKWDEIVKAYSFVSSMAREEEEKERDAAGLPRRKYLLQFRKP